MSEPINMTIHIGGSLPEKLLPDLLAIIDDQLIQAYIDVEMELRDSSTKKQPANISGESNYGECDDLKAFCEEHNLPYIHHCEAEGEYDASTSFWLPGMKEEKKLKSDQQGTNLVPAETVRPILDLAIAFIQSGDKALPLFIDRPGLEDIAEKALKNPKRLPTLLQAWVNKHVPIEPTLPPFQLI